MATPEGLTINQPLTDFATAYENKNFIADVVSPPIKVSAIAGTFQKRNRRDTARIYDDLIGSNGNANEVRYDLTNDSWLCEGRALKHVIPSIANNGIVSAISPEQEGVELLMQEIGLAHEYRVATVLTTAANYATANQVSVNSNLKWSNKTAGVPLDDIKAALRLLPSSGPAFKRIAWCSDVVYDALVTHPQLLALKGTTSGVVTDAEIVQFFAGLDGIVHSDVVRDTTNPGQTTPSFSRIWGQTAFGIVCVPVGDATPRSTIFAGSFRHTDGVRVRDWSENDGYGGRKVVQVEHMTQTAKVIQTDAGVLLSGVL